MNEHSHSHHHHDHGHHSHAPADFGRAFVIGIAINSLFVLTEVVFGIRANSLALLSDAGHNASDVLGLLMAWSATLLAKRKPSARFTYGLQSSSIITALANAVCLLLVTGGIAWEAVLRLLHAQAVTGTTVMAVAALGIVINGATALMFMKGREHDLNIRAAFQHMASDALIALGVVVAGAVILKTGWLWLDPAMSLVISFIIVAGTWRLFRDSLGLALHGVPAGINPTEVKRFLEAMPEVKEAHDLHIWAMSTTDIALSVHLLMQKGHPGDAFIKHVTHELDEHFHIGHPTIQIELGDDAADCALKPEHVV